VVCKRQAANVQLRSPIAQIDLVEGDFLQARALVSGKSRIFGLIVSEITNPFFPEIVQAFEDIAVQNHYEILLTSTVHDPKRMELAVRRMIERQTGSLPIGSAPDSEELAEPLTDPTRAS